MKVNVAKLKDLINELEKEKEYYSERYDSAEERYDKEAEHYYLAKYVVTNSHLEKVKEVLENE